MRVSGRVNLRGNGRFRQGRRIVAGAGLALLGAGCAGAADGPGMEEPPLPPADSVQAPTSERPDTVEGVINLEGSREPMTYHLYRSPADFPLSFSTYVPADMQAEEVDGDGERAVRFVAVFGGVRNEGMYVGARFPLAALPTEVARERAREIAEELGTVEPAGEGAPAWALESLRFSGEGGSVGRVSLGRHGSRYFFVVTRYPAEAGDGFGPRAARILDEWRWAEGGALGT